MARTTGPILTIGAITMVNANLVHRQPVNWRVPIATGLTAVMFALGEKGWEGGAVALAYLALITVIFVRVQPNVPSPVESILAFWEGG